jgi:hypothetical protein
LDLSKTIDQHFPASGSNCALKASGFHLMGETVFLVEIITPVGVCVFFWFLFLDWVISGRI